MGKFIRGQHYSWTSELGPNERFGVEDELSFQKLALKLEEKRNSEDYDITSTRISKSSSKISDVIQHEKLIFRKPTPTSQEFEELYLKLKTYHESRERAIFAIKNLAEKYPKINYNDNKNLENLLYYSEASQKLLKYYSKKFGN